MLDSMRRGANTLVAKIFFVVLIASFGVWGVSGVVMTGSTLTVAEVGDTRVEAADFQRRYTRQVQAISRQIGQPLDPATAAAFGIPQQVLGGMVADAALTEAARHAGLGIGDEALARQIADDPALRAPGAESFDRGYFNSLLRDNGYTEAAYVDERRRLALRTQLTEGVAGGMTTPEALVEAVHRFQNDVRTVDYVRLDRSAVEPVPDPGEEELVAWFKENQDEYQVPELRTIGFLAVTPETMADPAAVTAEDARKDYERTRQTYTTAEQRRIDQILFPSLADADAAAAKIRGGATFDQIAAERGLSAEDVSLGLVDRAGVVDPAVAEAAFALPAAGVSDPIDARFGGALVRVTEIVPETVRPFEAVEADIRRAIAERLAGSAVLEIHDEIEDARAGGATLAEVAERFRLPLRSITVDARGQGADGVPVDLAGADGLLAAAFAAEEGSDNDPIQAGNRGFVWFEVDKVEPARDKPLADVRTEAVTAWKEEKVLSLLSAKAAEMAGAVRSGGDLAALAAEAGSTVATAENITRNADVPGLGPAVGAAFDGPEGHVAAAEGPDGSHVVLKVTRSVIPPFFKEAADSVQAAQRFRDELETSLLAQYTEALQAELGTRVNDQVLRSVVGTGGE